MKIAVVKLDMMFQAGGQRQVYELIRNLVQKGHEVALYTAEINRAYFPELAKGLDIRVIQPRESITTLLHAESLWGKMKKKIHQSFILDEVMQRIADAIDEDTQAINCHDNSYRVGYYFKREHPAARVVWTMNDPPLMFVSKGKPQLDFPNRIYLWWQNMAEKKFFSSVDMIAVLDSYNARWAEKRHLKVEMVWSGLDFENFYAPVKPSSRKPFRLFSLGALNPYRRYEDVIDAVAILRDRGLSVEALIISKDIPYEKEYRKKLENLVRERNIAGMIRLNFDGVPEKELKEAYREGDAFVLSAYVPPPRNGYAWGLVAFEAAAAGMPVILCRTSGAVDALKDGEGCLAVSPMDPRDIADKVQFLIENPGEAIRIAGRGQQFTRDNISWEKYASKMENLLENS